jgi:Hsp20/alpha crystallin family protein
VRGCQGRIFARGNDLLIWVSGVYPEDVEITPSGGVQTVSGERRSELKEGEVHFYVRERYPAAFRLSITLPAGVGESYISAEFENGLLEITVHGAAPAHRGQEPARTRRGALYGLAVSGTPPDGLVLARQGRTSRLRDDKKQSDPQFGQARQPALKPRRLLGW